VKCFRQICRESQITRFEFCNFFHPPEIPAIYDKMWENMIESEGTQREI